MYMVTVDHAVFDLVSFVFFLVLHFVLIITLQWECNLFYLKKNLWLTIMFFIAILS